MSKHRFYGWTMLAALWAVMFLNQPGTRGGMTR